MRDIGVGSNPYDIAFGDIDGDGDMDVGVANWGSGTVSILRNNGDGTFATKVDSEGDSLSYRYRYRFDSVWVDADVEYVGRVGDTVVVLWHSYNDLPDTFGLVYFGVRVSSVSNVSIDSCIFEDNTSDGVNFYSSYGYVRYSNFVGKGVGVRANSGSVDLAGLGGNYYFKVECSDVDIGVSSVSNVSIDSCIFEDNTSDGVNFYSSNVSTKTKLTLCP